jgi:hypothetical protein
MRILANIAAREAHTARLLNDQPSPKGVVAKTAVESTEALFGWIYKQPGMATLEDCQAVLTRLHNERSPEDAIAALQRFGVKSLKEMFAGEYERFFQRVTTALFFGLSPAYPWTCAEDIRMGEFCRDRYLFWNHQMDRLWESKTKLGQELDSGEVSDVSGVPEFEKRFAEKGK